MRTDAKRISSCFYHSRSAIHDCVKYCWDFCQSYRGWLQVIFKMCPFKFLSSTGRLHASLGISLFTGQSWKSLIFKLSVEYFICFMTWVFYRITIWMLWTIIIIGLFWVMTFLYWMFINAVYCSVWYLYSFHLLFYICIKILLLLLWERNYHRGVWSATKYW